MSTYTFTPAQLWTAFLAICAAIVSISAAMKVVTNAIDKAKKPNKDQDDKLRAHDELLKELQNQITTLNADIQKMNTMGEKIDELDERVTQHDQLLSSDNKHFASIDEGNRVTQRAILALLSHALNGNSIELMRDSKNELETYLINR